MDAPLIYPSTTIRSNATHNCPRVFLCTAHDKVLNPCWECPFDEALGEGKQEQALWGVVVASTTVLLPKIQVEIIRSEDTLIASSPDSPSLVKKHLYKCKQINRRAQLQALHKSLLEWFHPMKAKILDPLLPKSVPFLVVNGTEET